MLAKLSRAQWTGLLLLVGGLVALVGIHLAELAYPGASVSEDFVSDLGATCADIASGPHDCVVFQPASAIFSVSVDVLGLTVLAAAYLAYPLVLPKRMSLILGATGLGALGVGLVSEAYSPFHSIFALTAFLGGSVAALMSFRILPRPVGYVALGLGGIALAALGWFSLLSLEIRATAAGTAFPSIWSPIGVGGMERMVIYPVLLWVVVFGTALLVLPGILAKPAIAAGFPVGTSADASVKPPV